MPIINVENSVSVIGAEIENSECSHFSKRKKNQRIELKAYNNISFLTSGAVSLYRLENNLLTLSIRGPAILGLEQMRNETKSHYLRCDMDCEMWVISTPDATDLFTQRNLWMHAYDILARHMQMYFERESLFSHPNIRAIVIKHLKYIWAQPIQERENISVYTFILARNQISRSGVHKVLKELSDSGDIQLIRGRLTWLKDS